MSETQDTSKWSIVVDGDSRHGWIVGVHDGDHQDTYWPEAANGDVARDKAIQAHLAKFFA